MPSRISLFYAPAHRKASMNGMLLQNENSTFIGDPIIATTYKYFCQHFNLYVLCTRSCDCLTHLSSPKGQTLLVILNQEYFALGGPWFAFRLCIFTLK